MRFLVFRLVAFLSVFLFASSANAQTPKGFQTYTNARFGYRLAYPQWFAPQKESDNGDGRRFVAGSDGAQITVWASNNALERSRQEAFSEAQKSADGAKRRVTYKRLGPKSFVVSGIEGGRLFYQKTLWKDAVSCTVLILYPKGSKKEYDRTVERIAASLAWR